MDSNTGILDDDILLNGMVVKDEKQCCACLLCLCPITMPYWSRDTLVRWYLLCMETTMDFATLRNNKRYVTNTKKKLRYFKKEVLLGNVTRNKILQIIYEETLTCKNLNLNVRQH